jgi:hypothetical protein
VSDPLTGTWTLKVEIGSDVIDLFYWYWVGGAVKDDTSTFGALVESLSGDVVPYPEPILLSAAVGKDFTITGIAVSGTIEAPDGYYDVFTMRDDGVAPDDVADDGVYAALVDYWTEGDHYITVGFDNSAGNAKFTNIGVAFAPNPDGETPATELTPVEENFERFAEIQVSVTNWQEDDHSNWPDDPDWPATVLQTDNTPVAGRIDFADDVDVFEITVPGGYTGTLGLRIDNLGLYMDPYLYIYAADWSWEFDAYLEFVPTSDDFLFVPLSVSPGETLYVEVWHWDWEAAAGVYDVSVGPYLPSDPTAAAAPKAAPPQTEYFLYLPIILNNYDPAQLLQNGN